MEYVGIVALIVAVYAAYKASQKPNLPVRVAAVNPGYSKRESDAQLVKLAEDIGQDIEHVRQRAYALQERVLKLESKD